MSWTRFDRRPYAFCFGAFNDYARTIRSLLNTWGDEKYENAKFNDWKMECENAK